jgi:iron uptake system component EfeO
MLTARPVALLSLFLLLVAGTGCASSKSSKGSKGSTSKLTVTSSESTCEVSSTSLDAGTHTFSVTNKGSDATEVYVYADGDKVVGEVEDIGPGLTRDLKVKLAAGSYSVACKPGQKGDGIRTLITVTG